MTSIPFHLDSTETMIRYRERDATSYKPYKVKETWNRRLREALDSAYWYTGVYAREVVEDTDKEGLHLDVPAGGIRKIWRVTSTVTGEDAYVVKMGSQRTLYADRETVFASHRRRIDWEGKTMDPREVLDIKHPSYQKEWAAWAVEEIGATEEQCSFKPKEEWESWYPNHSPPTGEGESIASVLADKEEALKEFERIKTLRQQADKQYKAKRKAKREQRPACVWDGCTRSGTLLSPSEPACRRCALETSRRPYTKKPQSLEERLGHTIAGRVPLGPIKRLRERQFREATVPFDT